MMVQVEEAIDEEEHPDTIVKSPAQPIHGNGLDYEHVDQLRLFSTLSKDRGGRERHGQTGRVNRVRGYEVGASILEPLKFP